MRSLRTLNAQTWEFCDKNIVLVSFCSAKCLYEILKFGVLDSTSF